MLIIQEKPELLVSAQQIFGDIVVKVYAAYTYDDWDPRDRERAIEHLNNIKAEVGRRTDHSPANTAINAEPSKTNPARCARIRFDGEMIVLDFANGRRVFFEANDYAAFGPATNVDFA